MPGENDEDQKVQRSFNRAFATSLGFPDKRYVIVCHGCNVAWGRERNSKLVKSARRGDATHDCDGSGPVELVRDNRPEQ